MNARTEEQKRERWLFNFGSEDRVEWTRAQRSIISGKMPCVNAHTRGTPEQRGGTSMKSHYTTIVPITDEEHQLVHQHGWSHFGLTEDQLIEHAAEHERRWLAHSTRHICAW